MAMDDEQMGRGHERELDPGPDVPQGDARERLAAEACEPLSRSACPPRTRPLEQERSAMRKALLRTWVRGPSAWPNVARVLRKYRIAYDDSIFGYERMTIACLVAEATESTDGVGLAMMTLVDAYALRNRPELLEPTRHVFEARESFDAARDDAFLTDVDAIVARRRLVRKTTPDSLIDSKEAVVLRRVAPLVEVMLVERYPVETDGNTLTFFRSTRILREVLDCMVTGQWPEDGP